jgi:hypothetical protein
MECMVDVELMEEIEEVEAERESEGSEAAVPNLNWLVVIV